MIRMRSARVLAGAMVVISVLAFATAGYAASVHKYSGKTSQNQPISFQTAHGYLTHLKFYITDKCPSGNRWRIHDFSFPKFRVRQGKFEQKFDARHARAHATIKGTVSDHSATGTISERRFIAKEKHFCTGSAKFTIKRT